MPASNRTLSDFRTDLKLVYVPEGNNPYTDAYYNRQINSAILDIARQIEVPELQRTNTALTLSTATRAYSYAAFSPEVLFILSVKNSTDDTFLDLLSRDEAENYDESETGEPRFYWAFGENFNVYPLPTSDYNGSGLRVRYVARPNALTADSNTSPLPRDLDRAVLQYAKFLVFTDAGEPERAAQEFAIYRGILNSYVEVEAREFERARTSLRIG